MRIKEIMSRNVECIQPDMFVTEAAKRMKSLDVGAIPVCGNDDKLVGMITDRDIAMRCVADGSDSQSTKVKDVMTPDIVYCQEDQDVSDAAEIIKQRQIRRLVVLNNDKQLVGILSLGDLAVRAGHEITCDDTLEAVSAPG